jgi:hypothetical protein
MKTIPLRQLVREPIRVKRWTRAGQTVQITDHGEPLWTLHAAVTPSDEAKRRQDIEELLDEMLAQPKSPFTLSRIIKDSRR